MTSEVQSNLVVFISFSLPRKRAMTVKSLRCPGVRRVINFDDGDVLQLPRDSAMDEILLSFRASLIHRMHQ
jgi:hypothetical protein